MDDELTGIFDDLTPDDFKQAAGANVGSVAFSKFVETYLRTTQWAYKISDGNMLNPIVILATASETYEYLPTDDETLGEFVDRLSVEAKRLGATWFFLSRKTLVGGKVIDPKNVVDISDPSSLQSAIDDGLVAHGVYFYAERRELGEPVDIRHGIINVVKGHELGQPIMSDPRQGSTFYAGVLGENADKA